MSVAGAAHGAEAEPPAPKPSNTAPSDWAGYYLGVTAGGAWGAFSSLTSTNGGRPGDYLTRAQGVTVSAAGRQRITAPGFDAGIEGGRNWQSGRLVFGLEGDLQSVHMNGEASSGPIVDPAIPPATQFVVTSYMDSNWLLTVRPRLGLAGRNWLVYGTGGVAFVHLDGDFVFSDARGALQSGSVDAVKTGYAVGGGIEARLTDRVSVKAEYLHIDSGRTTASENAGTLAATFPSQTFAHSTDLRANLMRVGFNYRFGGAEARAGSGALNWPPSGPAWAALKDWSVEAGSRVWFSSGSIGAPQPLLNVAPPGQIVASRLIYSGEFSYSAEVFARADHASGWFIKGLLGGGGIANGDMHDEDFPGYFDYSNTLQSNNSGNLAYATADLGYAVLRPPGAKIGPFIGYNYYAQHVNTFGCVQLAGDSVCADHSIPPDYIGISEDDQIHSLRVGVSTQARLTDRLELTAEAAYLPWLSMKGQDDHNRRQLLLPETAGNGDGAMLEGTLGYDVTDAWSVALGARYWTWNIRDVVETFNFLGAGVVGHEPARFTTERYGGFVQASYRWGAPQAAVRRLAANEPLPGWTGLYVGGYFGGGLGDDRWSDPFPSAPSPIGGVNIAGFGDRTHATGPLGGGEVGYNRQAGKLVYGVELDGGPANLRGENTCFSGLGGLNCRRLVGVLATLTGRFGYAWNRSLIYAKAGGAWLGTKYEVTDNGFTDPPRTDRARVSESGFAVGVGLEQALGPNWSTKLEYDYLGMSGDTLAFSTIVSTGGRSIGIRQHLNLLKLGSNYRFR